MARYEAGETLASIARTYDCSPPAISYIVSRSRERQPAAETAIPAVEPQLVKAHAEPVAAAAAAPPPVVTRPDPAAFDAAPGLMATLARPAAPRPEVASATNGDARRTLHLSLGGNGANGNGHTNGNGADHSGNGYPAPTPPPQAQAQPQPSQPQNDRFEPRPPMPPRYNYQTNGGGEPGEARKKDAGSFIDKELRARVDADIAAFLAAFDAALAGDTQESRAGLREASDRLLRAGARTRIELERLEARVPLSSTRDGDSRPEPNWRHR